MGYLTALWTKISQYLSRNDQELNPFINDNQQIVENAAVNAVQDDEDMEEFSNNRIHTLNDNQQNLEQQPPPVMMDQSPNPRSSSNFPQSQPQSTPPIRESFSLFQEIELFFIQLIFSLFPNNNNEMIHARQRRRGRDINDNGNIDNQRV